MNPCGDATMSAKYLHRFDNELWAEIDPIEKKRNLKFDTPSRIKKKIEAKPKKKKEKEEEKEGKKIRIRNTQFSFTSFLIPLCVTGERKDYQFLYCICALRNALKILSTTLRKEGFAQLYMVGMKSAVDWEKIKANRTTFSDIITEFLIKSGSVCMVAANRKELYTKVNNPDAPFIVLLAATDIQLPSREKLCVGTSWLIFRDMATSYCYKKNVSYAALELRFS
ncbi:unnamed protein product [Nezara viridula]|uniref:Uncharacterized protein n=1 Tax=Nezara viridula TaxID=85310 RepID=A0A9P0HRV1_NEZVI|nr:unnamed protein product [Nezara viridula]